MRTAYLIVCIFDIVLDHDAFFRLSCQRQELLVVSKNNIVINNYSVFPNYTVLYRSSQIKAHFIFHTMACNSDVSDGRPINERVIWT